MKYSKRFSFLITVILATGCGLSKDSDPATTSDNQTCPSLLMIPHHQITVASSTPIPTKLAVILEGQRKYDECLEEPVEPIPPIIRLVRDKDTVILDVQHLGAYKTLPNDVSFELIDLGDCTGHETSFFSAEQVPLMFKKEYPYGQKCGVNTHAEVKLER